MYLFRIIRSHRRPRPLLVLALAAALVIGVGAAQVVAMPPAAADEGIPSPEEQEAAWNSLTADLRGLAMDISRDNIVEPAVSETNAAMAAAAQAAASPPAAAESIMIEPATASVSGGSSRTDVGTAVADGLAATFRAHPVLGFGDPQGDGDSDALPDAFENSLAQLFMPEYHVSANEDNGVGFGRFADQRTLVSGPVIRQRPPIVHLRVTGVGGAPASDGTLYGFIRADYLTLWNKDSGYVNGPVFPCFAVGLIPGHDNDPERSALLLAAPVVNDGGNLRYNPDPNAYQAHYQFTTAHEDFPATNEDRFLQISPPSAPNDHGSLRLYLARSKHGTYPFNPDGHPVIVPELRIQILNVVTALDLDGRLARLIEDGLRRIGIPVDPVVTQLLEVAIYYVVVVVLEVCAAEDFDEQGGDVPTDALNVGEHTRTLPGFTFAAYDDVREKLTGLPVRAPRGTRTCAYSWVREKFFAVDEYFVGCRAWLIMQSDGNLVLYDSYDVPLWSTGTVSHPGATAVFQSDGNLVVYAPGGGALWASNTVNRAVNGRFVLQDDGNLVIYDSSGWPVWDRHNGLLPLPPTPYTLTSVNSSKCLDVAGSSQDNGATVQQWDCHTGANQQWRLSKVGLNTYTLTSISSGKCLDVNGFSMDDGARVQQWDCHGGNNQRWVAQPTGSVGTFTLMSVNSGKCLDVNGYSMDNGGVVQQWGCHGGTNQQWRVISIIGVPLPVTLPPPPPPPDCLRICPL